MGDGDDGKLAFVEELVLYCLGEEIPKWEILPIKAKNYWRLHFEPIGHSWFGVSTCQQLFARRLTRDRAEDLRCARASLGSGHQVPALITLAGQGLQDSVSEIGV